MSLVCLHPIYEVCQDLFVVRSVAGLTIHHECWKYQDPCLKDQTLYFWPLDVRTWDTVNNLI